MNLDRSTDVLVSDTWHWLVLIMSTMSSSFRVRSLRFRGRFLTQTLILSEELVDLFFDFWIEPVMMEVVFARVRVVCVCCRGGKASDRPLADFRSANFCPFITLRFSAEAELLRRLLEYAGWEDWQRSRTEALNLGCFCSLSLPLVLLKLRLRKVARLK